MLKSELIEELATLRALVAELAESKPEATEATPAKATRAKATPKPKAIAPSFRVVKAGAGRSVSMPEPVNGHALGTTWATWREGDAKRRAWAIEGALVIDTRGLNAEQVKAIGALWNKRAKSRAQGALVVFSKAGN